MIPPEVRLLTWKYMKGSKRKFSLKEAAIWAGDTCNHTKGLRFCGYPNLRHTIGTSLEISPDKMSCFEDKVYEGELRLFKLWNMIPTCKLWNETAL